MLYILDEPSIGLHQRQRDAARFLEAFEGSGNTIIVVEHDEETIRSADYVVDSAKIYHGRRDCRCWQCERPVSERSITGRSGKEEILYY